MIPYRYRHGYFCQAPLARLAGDLVIAAFFSAEKDTDRKQRLDDLLCPTAKNGIKS